LIRETLDGVNDSSKRIEAVIPIASPANYLFIIRMNSEYASQVQTVKRLHFRDAVFKDQRTELSLSDLQTEQKRGPAINAQGSNSQKTPQFRAIMRKTVSRLCFGYLQLSRILVVAT